MRDRKVAPQGLGNETTFSDLLTDSREDPAAPRVPIKPYSTSSYQVRK